MTIFIDADACPVILIIESLAQEYQVNCVIVCDHNHMIHSKYSEIIMVDTGFDSADLYIINKAKRKDILITQDYGLASLALSKQLFVMDHFGKEYTQDNIESLLMIRHLNQNLRRQKNYRGKGPKKRSESDNQDFALNFNNLLKRML